MNFRHTWAINRQTWCSSEFNALRTEAYESTSYTWSALKELRCDKYKCYFCDWIRSLRLDIIATLEIIILYLISHVYQVHTAAETSPSPAHATVYHGQSAKCWKLESTYLCGNNSEPVILWIIVLHIADFTVWKIICQFFFLQKRSKMVANNFIIMQSLKSKSKRIISKCSDYWILWQLHF